MFTVAIVITVCCAAVPLSTFVRMLIDRPAVLRIANSRTPDHSTATRSDRTHAHDKGAAPIPPRTKAAPFHPATRNEHEVHPS